MENFGRRNADVKTQLNSELNGKANSGHTHDDRYFTESEITTKLNGKANSSHTHDDRYYTESEINSKLTNMCRVQYKEVTSSTPDWVVVGTSGIHYILAAQIYTANNFYVRILYNMGVGFVLQVCDLNGNKVTSGSYTIGIAYIPK